MRSADEHTKTLEDPFYRELRVLEEVDSSPDLSQRRLAYQLGIALGVTNLLVRKLAKQGYIRVTQLSWKRWAYALTPAGMTRKLYLTKAYIERFIDHYRRVRHLLREDLRSQPLSTESRVAIVGTTELAELAFLALRDIGVHDIEVFTRNADCRIFLGIPVKELGTLTPSRYAKVIFAGTGDLEGSRKELHACGVSESQIVEILDQRRPMNHTEQRGTL